MLEPLSIELQKLLIELKLCTLNDVRRCRSRVRRLSHDLPAFDSVWIDALVQARKLTSFQAKILESSNPDRLRLGPCVLVDRMGGGLISETFLARRIEGNDRCVLKEISLSAEEAEVTSKRLQKLLKGWEGQAHPAIILPHAFNTLDGLPDQPGTRRIVTISRFAPGPHLAELMMRRGRFPATIVSDLGHQLLEGLTALEQRGLIHGNIRLSDIRLTSNGSAVLVDTGIESAIHPELISHANLTPETFDGTAPELIGTGNRATIASDLYSLGCLMWHLLAGRPPFPTGDPLAKLAAHQTQQVPDIRDWAPDTPSDIAEFIQWLTQRDPKKRPQSAQGATEQWGSFRKRGHRRLENFRANFESAVPKVPSVATTSSASRWAILLTLLFVVSGAVLTMMDSGLRSEILSLASGVSETFSDHQPTPDLPENEEGVDEHIQESEGGSVENDLPKIRLRPLPGPDANGIITLTSPGPYEAAEISAVGPLMIQGDERFLPEIIVSDKPLRIWAEQVVLKNVHFRREAAEFADQTIDSTGTTLLLVQTQNLSISECSFQLGQKIASKARVHQSHDHRDERETSIAIAWKSIDTADPTGGNIILKNTVFSGKGTSLFLAAVPRQVQVANCLKSGTGAFINFINSSSSDHPLRVSLENTTLRQSGSLLRIQSEIRSALPASIAIETKDCVFDIDTDHAFIEFIAEKVSADWPAAIQVNGEGSLISSAAEMARTIAPTGKIATAADTSSMQIEGLASGSFQYASPSTEKPEQSVVTKWQAPRRSSNPPGIDPAGLRIPQSVD